MAIIQPNRNPVIDLFNRIDIYWSVLYVSPPGGWNPNQQKRNISSFVFEPDREHFPTRAHPHVSFAARCDLVQLLFFFTTQNTRTISPVPINAAVLQSASVSKPNLIISFFILGKCTPAVRTRGSYRSPIEMPNREAVKSELETTEQGWKWIHDAPPAGLVRSRLVVGCGTESLLVPI